MEVWHQSGQSAIDILLAVHDSLRLHLIKHDEFEHLKECQYFVGVHVRSGTASFGTMSGVSRKKSRAIGETKTVFTRYAQHLRARSQLWLKTPRKE